MKIDAERGFRGSTYIKIDSGNAHESCVRIVFFFDSQSYPLAWISFNPPSIDRASPIRYYKQYFQLKAIVRKYLALWHWVVLIVAFWWVTARCIVFLMNFLQLRDTVWHVWTHSKLQVTRYVPCDALQFSTNLVFSVVCRHHEDDR